MMRERLPFTSSDGRTEREEPSGGFLGRKGKSLLVLLGPIVLRSAVKRALSTDRDGPSSGASEREAAAERTDGGGGNLVRWLVGAAVLVGIGYALRDRWGPIGGSVRGGAGERSGRIADRTDEMAHEAADRVREGGESVAERTDTTMEEAADRMESTGQEVSEQLEERSEELGERIEEGGEEASESIDSSREGNDDEEE